MAAVAIAAMRNMAAARGRNNSFMFEYAGGRACLISVPRLHFVLEKASSQKAAVRHPMKVATIRLQWNRKPKMMPLAKVVLPKQAWPYIQLKRRLPAKAKGYIENVRHVEA